MKKPRLYIALYDLNGALREANNPSGPQDYHWTLFIAPRDASSEQTGVRYRLRQTESWSQVEPRTVEFEKLVWEVDKSAVPLGRHDDIVARVLVAKVQDDKAVDEYILSTWPEKTMHAKQTGRAPTSKDWVERVLGGFSASSPDSKWLMVEVPGKDWATTESCCTAFATEVVQKGAVTGPVPTFDLLKNKEVSE